MDFEQAVERFFFGRATPATAERVLASEILLDVRGDIMNGLVPATVGTFADLHDYVDANCYGSLDKWPGDLNDDRFVSMVNRAQSRVDAALREGRL